MPNALSKHYKTLHDAIGIIEEQERNELLAKENIEAFYITVSDLEEFSKTKEGYCKLVADIQHRFGIDMKRCMQVIGSSAAFSNGEAAYNLLLNYVKNKSIGFIFYGVTHDGGANKLVEDLLKDTQLHDKPIVIGNLVEESFSVIEQYGCEASEETNHFIVLHNNYQEPLVHFGSDIKLSDCCRILCCIEGGIQSLAQCINTLRSVNWVFGDYPEIILICNANPIDDSLFSAARFLRDLKYEIEQKGKSFTELLGNRDSDARPIDTPFMEQYLKDHRLLRDDKNDKNKEVLANKCLALNDTLISLRSLENPEKSLRECFTVCSLPENKQLDLEASQSADEMDTNCPIPVLLKSPVKKSPLNKNSDLFFQTKAKEILSEAMDTMNYPPGSTI